MIWILFLLAVCWRFQDLGLKAVHHDESINGWFVMQIWDQGWFQYDPSNYHGPLFFYMLALAERLGGFGIESFRAVTALFSALWLLYLWGFWKREGWSGKWILLIVALSPGFFFFGRSAIHEMPFLFFLTLGLGGLYELLRKQEGRGWISIIWGAMGVLTLKETWAVMVVALLASGVFLLVVSPVARSRLRFWREPFQLFPRSGPIHVGLALLLVYLLFTGFGVRPMGLVDMVTTFFPWMKTGVHGSGHDKAWSYWLQLLWEHEKPLLFLLFGMLSSTLAFWRRLSVTTQWLVLGSLIQFVIYSLIPYKTPWCMISVFGPMIFAMGSLRGDLQGLGFVNPVQVLCGLLAVVALYFQYPAMKKLNFEKPSDKGHDYVYVQSDRLLKKLVDALSAAAEAEPALYKERLQFAGTEAWPLSWWLARFPQVQQPFRDGLVKDPLLVVVDQGDEEAALKRLPPDDYFIFRFPIREGRETSLFFVRKEGMPEELKL